ncbi:MAG: hypothetical protein HGA47_03780 [Zoogloea sp.]|nr:hypothetical protein [Zoogloea sp.]
MAAAAYALGDVQLGYDPNYESKTDDWREGEVKLPPYPAEADLVPFDAGPTATNRFMIDARSLSVGEDGVVRYTLVVRTPGGAENVTYEGIRCKTYEKRVYAVAARSGEWAKSRNDAWSLITDNRLNRHHAALADEYLCQDGSPVAKAGVALDRLRRSVRSTSLTR